MKYRRMPSIKEDLSILGFGCMRFPLIDEDITKIDEPKAREMLQFAIDNGVNYLDTAYPYHGTQTELGGESEPFLGSFLSDGLRDKIMLATKLPSWYIEKREDMDKYLSRQLNRLQTDYIDFYLVHALNSKYWSALKPMDLTGFLDSAKKDGKIRYAGFSFHDDSIELFKEIVDAYDWDFCQIQYNYLDENYQAGKEGLDYAVSKGLGIVVMEPLRGGSLADNMPDDTIAEFNKANPERTPVDWALNWLWKNENVHVILSGMSTLEQVEENIELASEERAGQLSETELAAIDRVKDIMRSKKQVPCTRCGYCMPCPHGVDIPRNFMYYNNYHRFDDNKNRANSKIMYKALLSEDQQSISCVECGTCEEQCPQNIPIIASLKKVTTTMK